MKIGNRINVQNVMKSYNKTTTNVKKQNKVSLSPDKIEISDAAKEYQVAMHAFKKMPEVREDLVNEIKQQIKEGSYKPSSEDIAKKIIASLSSID